MKTSFCRADIVVSEIGIINRRDTKNAEGIHPGRFRSLRSSCLCGNLDLVVALPRCDISSMCGHWVALRRSRRYDLRMSKVKKLLHTRYRVDDLEKTVNFYKDVLGLEETRRHKSPRGSELVFLKAPDSEELIEICSFPDSGPVHCQEDLTHLAFSVDSLEEFGKHLASLGIEYSDGPRIKDDGSGFAFIDAPEGYEIELMQGPNL